MENTTNNQIAKLNTNRNGNALALGLGEVVVGAENLVVRNQPRIPLSLMKAVMNSEATNEANPVKTIKSS